MIKTWSAEEDALLRRIYQGSDKKSLEAAFGTDYGRIKGRAMRLGLRKGTRRLWAADDEAKLAELYPNMEIDDLMKVFERPALSIFQKAAALGLKKSEAHRQKLRAKFIQMLEDSGKHTRFKKGMVPNTKGRKWSEYMPERSQKNCMKTTFKKGQVPHNHRPIGYERVTRDGYIEVKVRDFGNSKMNFEAKHRLTWERYNGPIPEGYVIKFIDGDRMNCNISNLVLQSMRDNLLKNATSDISIVKRFFKVRDHELAEDIVRNAPEMIQVKRKTIIVKQKIDECRAIRKASE